MILLVLLQIPWHYLCSHWEREQNLVLFFTYFAQCYLLTGHFSLIPCSLDPPLPERHRTARHNETWLEIWSNCVFPIYTHTLMHTAEVLICISSGKITLGWTCFYTWFPKVHLGLCVCLNAYAHVVAMRELWLPLLQRLRTSLLGILVLDLLSSGELRCR